MNGLAAWSRIAPTRSCRMPPRSRLLGRWLPAATARSGAMPGGSAAAAAAGASRAPGGARLEPAQAPGEREAARTQPARRVASRGLPRCRARLSAGAAAGRRGRRRRGERHGGRRRHAAARSSSPGGRWRRRLRRRTTPTRRRRPRWSPAPRSSRPRRTVTIPARAAEGGCRCPPPEPAGSLVVAARDRRVRPARSCAPAGRGLGAGRGVGRLPPAVESCAPSRRAAGRRRRSSRRPRPGGCSSRRCATRATPRPSGGVS